MTSLSLSSLAIEKKIRQHVDALYAKLRLSFDIFG